MAAPLSESRKIEIAQKSIELIAQGMTLNKIAEELKVSRTTVAKLLHKDPRYDRALQIRAMLHLDDMRDMMNELIDGKGNKLDIMRYREIRDSIKWLMGKEMPNRYGDRQQIELKVNNLNDLLKKLPDD